MYNSQEIATLISEEAKKKGVSVNKAVIDSEAGKSFVDNLKKGQNPSAFGLAKIANYFGVSTDFLLGNDVKHGEGYSLMSVNNLDSRLAKAIDTFTENVKERLIKSDFEDNTVHDALYDIGAEVKHVFDSFRLSIVECLAGEEKAPRNDAEGQRFMDIIGQDTESDKANED
ncbi:MAG: hypothetical protein LBU77_00015 [Clostridiales bacterium]|nr:hypothetical protein [Clostridiales bacterium]